MTTTTPLTLEATMDDIDRPGTPRISAAGATDIGKARSSNEDAFLVASVQRSLVLQASNLPKLTAPAPNSEATLLVVADGMGGEGSGDVASRLGIEGVVSTLSRSFQTGHVASAAAIAAGRDSLSGVRTTLRNAVASGDARVARAAHEPENSPTMGSTLTMAYLVPPWLYVAHVGDSRCYLSRDGQLSQLTHDHTLAERCIAAGGTPPEQYFDVLCNALGAGMDGIEPELCKTNVQRGDVVLLCSDGLNKHVSNEELANVLKQRSSVEQLCNGLVALANERGGSDNTTVVVARVH